MSSILQLPAWFPNQQMDSEAAKWHKGSSLQAWIRDMLVAPDLTSNGQDNVNLAKKKENYSEHKMNILYEISWKK